MLSAASFAFIGTGGTIQIQQVAIVIGQHIVAIEEPVTAIPLDSDGVDVVSIEQNDDIAVITPDEDDDIAIVPVNQDPTKVALPDVV